MKILVTGASGFIGGHLAIQLAKVIGNKILATGRSNTNRFKDHTNIEYQVLDLTGDLPELNCDVCIHAAGLADDKSTADQLTQANVLATANLIEALRGCTCFIYISSASVYDFADGKPKLEADASMNNLISDYGRTKLEGEEIVLRSDFRSKYILRPRAVYGLGDRVLMPRILKLMGKRRIVLPGPIESTSSMTNVQNLCHAIELCIAKAQVGAHIYNIADRETYQLKDIFGEISLIKNGHRNFFHIPMAIVDFLIWTTKNFGIKSVLTRQSVDYLNRDSVLIIEKAQKELDYKPTIDFFSVKDSLGL